MKRYQIFLVVVTLALLGAGCGNKEANTNTAPVAAVQNTPAESANNKLCDWVDKSDIIIKLNFAEGVEKDSSYEAGFYLSPMYLNARLARKDCDYRTGFSFAELKGKGAAQVGTRGYTDNRRRQLANEPVSIVFDAEGHPDIGNYIVVTVKD